jgi:hypothetical protein
MREIKYTMRTCTVKPNTLLDQDITKEYRSGIKPLTHESGKLYDVTYVTNIVVVCIFILEPQSFSPYILLGSGCGKYRMIH